MFTTIDWVIIGIYLALAFTIGALMTKKASRGVTSYFIAGRSLPWWWLGTSMVATTFAADTPLAITGIVAKDGVSGNWFWWSWIFTFATITIFFARKWRATGVLTDVEFIELRYEGRNASYLRGFKAFYLSIIVNCFILGWVFRAMSKITTPFVDWEQILGTNLFREVYAFWPKFLIFDNFNNTLTVLVIFLIVVTYSSMGGIRGVILTDLFQFALAIGTALLFAILAVGHLGGLEGLFTKLEALYPGRAGDITSIWPKFDNVVFPFEVFLIFIGIQWWAQYYSDGSGYLAQRINAAKTPEDAEKGSLWFALANFALRTWPWIVVALVALVMFPIGDPTKYSALGEAVGADREMGYPMLMKLILPAGLLGLTFTSLMAAFMSTVDTHINWGASYLMNDIYSRFIRPNASRKEKVFASRGAVITIAITAILVASQITSIEQAWKFFISIGAGLGMPQLLRWIWWRANAWTEIAGMTVAFIASVTLHTLFSDVRTEYLLFWVVLASVSSSIAATLLTKPVSDKKLKLFIDRIYPFGFWRGLTSEHKAKNRMLKRTGMWLLTVISVMCCEFAIGYFILLEWEIAVVLLIVFIITFIALIKLMSSERMRVREEMKNR